MSQMIAKANANVAQKSFKVTNHGWYIADYEVQYTFQGEVFNVDSGIFSLGMEKKIFIPETATNITIKISVAVGVDWNVIESKFLKVMETMCFILYGTLFTPYALEVNCTAPPDLGGTPNPNPNQCCCCCNCCGVSPSGMSMEEYMNYLSNFHNKQNI